MRKINTKKSHKKYFKKTKHYSKKQKGGTGKCIDFISGEELDVEEYITENPDNLVFQLDDSHFMCSTREDLKKNIDSYIVYICNKEVKFTGGFHSNIAPDGSQIYNLTPYVTTRELGINWGGISSLENIYKVVIRTNAQMFSFKKIGDAVATVSKNVIDNQKASYRGEPFDIDYMVSAMHCQPGSNRPIYKILSKELPNYEDVEGERFTPVAQSLASRFDMMADEDDNTNQGVNIMEPRLNLETKTIDDPTFIEYLKNQYKIAISGDYRESEKKSAFKKLINGINNSLTLLLTSFFGFDYKINIENNSQNLYNIVTSQNEATYNFLSVDSRLNNELPLVDETSKISLIIMIPENDNFNQSKLENIIGKIRQFISSINSSKKYLIFLNFFTISNVEQVQIDKMAYLFNVNKYNVSNITSTGQQNKIVIFNELDRIVDSTNDNYFRIFPNDISLTEIIESLNSESLEELTKRIINGNYLFYQRNINPSMIRRLEIEGVISPYSASQGIISGGKKNKFKPRNFRKTHKRKIFKNYSKKNQKK